MTVFISNEAPPARPVQLNSPARARPSAPSPYICPLCSRVNLDGRDGCHPYTPDGYGWILHMEPPAAGSHLGQLRAKYEKERSPMSTDAATQRVIDDLLKAMQERQSQVILESLMIPASYFNPLLNGPKLSRDSFYFKSFPEFPKEEEIIQRYARIAETHKLQNSKSQPSRNAQERLRGWPPRTDDWQPSDQGEHMSFNANTVQQMIQPALNAAFEADQRATQVQAQLDTVNGQLRSVRSELDVEKARTVSLQVTVDNTKADAKYYRETIENTQRTLTQKVQDTEKKVRETERHHQECIAEIAQAAENKLEDMRVEFEDHERSIRQSYERQLQNLRDQQISFADAVVLLNPKARGNGVKVKAILAKVFGNDFQPTQALKAAFKKVTKNGKK